MGDAIARLHMSCVVRADNSLGDIGNMMENEIYVLTPQGEKELRGGTTVLSAAEVELLVRIDGVQTGGQLRASMSSMPAEKFSSIFHKLHDQRLLTVAQVDPFAEQFQFHLDKQALMLAGAEADSGAMSLNKAGYYVSIAR